MFFGSDNTLTIRFQKFVGFPIVLAMGNSKKFLTELIYFPSNNEFEFLSYIVNPIKT